MARTWTDEQKTAIGAPCGPLLVSAAAGSGKTAVLIERILRAVAGPDARCDLDELLVVTFTNAAASEMRGKLAAALSEAIALNPGHARLRRQLSLLPYGHMETVHGFCLSLLRENFHEAGISPDFRVLGETEAELLKAEALETVLERNYKEGQAPFLAAVELFSGPRDDERLGRVLMEIHGKLQSHPDPAGWLRDFEERLIKGGDEDPASTPWGRYLLTRAAETAEGGLGFLRAALDEMADCPQVEAAYGPAFSADLAVGQTLLAACRAGDWDEAYRVAGEYRPDRLASVRGFSDKAWLARIKGYRELFKKWMADIAEKMVFADGAEVARDLRLALPPAVGLCRLIRDFSDAYQAKKARKNKLDFSDLEHLALGLLVKKEGDGFVRTPLALELSERFEEILVDEYQDTNRVQDLLFEALSDEGKNLFFVGDVKQSIYGFRMADPTIFLEKYRAFSDGAGEEDGEETPGRRLHLSRNFRSRKQVLSLVNFLFKADMQADFGGLDYTEKEALYPGACYPLEEDERYAPELLMTERPAEGAEEQKAAGREAAAVAARIRGLLDGGFPITDGETGETRPARPGDVAILLRSVSGKAALYVQALQKEGVPVRSDDGGEFFKTAEILCALSFLQVLAGGAEDVPLLSVMCSPVYGFTPDELGRIRLKYPKLPFFTAVLRAAEEGEERTGGLIRDLSRLRAAAVEMPVSRLVWVLLHDTGLLNAFSAMDGGRARRGRLLALYQCACSFEKQGEADLARFVAYLNGMAQSGRTPAEASGQSAEDAVLIQSIHRSKGLEYPVVVVADCAKLFNEDDLRRPVLFQAELGLGVRARDPDRLAEYPTALRHAIADRVRVDMLTEELRILYVAMTRAREKLILSLSVEDVSATLTRLDAFCLEGKLSPAALKSQRSPLLWILGPFLCAPGGESWLRAGGRFPLPDGTFVTLTRPAGQNAGGDEEKEGIEAGRPEPDDPAKKPGGAEQDETPIEASWFTPYPHAAACDLPSKLTVTSLKPRFADREAAEGGVSVARRPAPLEQPVFSVEAGGVTGADRGSAYHLALQLMDFDRCVRPGGLGEEIGRLVRQRLLTKEQADALSRVKLGAFFASPLVSRMCKAKEIYREFKFSLLLPAGQFFAAGGTEDQVLMQGVMDCLFFEEDGGVLVDYKSDRIRPGQETERSKRYKVQLLAYRAAAERIFERPVKETVVYFLETDKAVLVDEKPDGWDRREGEGFGLLHQP